MLCMCMQAAPSGTIRGRRSRSSGKHSSGGGGDSRHSSGLRVRSSSSSIRGQQQKPRQQQGPWQDLKPLMDALDSCASCSEVLQVVLEADAAAGQQGVHMFVLSKALDTMKKKAACDGGSATDRRAVEQLLRLAAGRLSGFSIRTLTAFVRCAAAFPGLLQPQQLRAWQAALQQHKPIDVPAQNVSNMLLALGTLAQSDGQLAAVASQPLAERLLQHAVRLASRGELQPLQPIGNTLYGLALLGLQPRAAQMQQLFSAVEQALEQPLRSDDYVNVTQILLACAQWMNIETPAGEAPAPTENPFHRYYPGAVLVDALLSRAAACAALNVHSASQIVNACGRLLHMPTPEHWALLLAGGQRRWLLAKQPNGLCVSHKGSLHGSTSNCGMHVPICSVCSLQWQCKARYLRRRKRNLGEAVPLAVHLGSAYSQLNSRPVLSPVTEPLTRCPTLLSDGLCSAARGPTHQRH